MVDKLIIFITIFGILFNTIETRPGKQKKRNYSFQILLTVFSQFHRLADSTSED